MRPLARVLVDESHRQAWSTRADLAALMNPVNPGDASYAQAALAAKRAGLALSVHAEGALDSRALAGVDVLVLPHAAEDEWEHTTGAGSPRLTPDELDAVEQFVTGGGGLIILAETEQAKYGNNFADLAHTSASRSTTAPHRIRATATRTCRRGSWRTSRAVRSTTSPPRYPMPASTAREACILRSPTAVRS